MRKLTLAIAPVAALLLGNTPALAGSAGSADPISADPISKARTILEDNLLDYSKARLRGFHVVRHIADAKTAERVNIRAGTPVVALCGEVNAPNQFGALTGWRRTAIIVQGRDFDPLITVASDGYTNISEVAAVCTITGPSGTVGPAGAQVDPADVSTALQQGSTPGSTSTSAGTPVVSLCGKMNTSNGFGALTGWRDVAIIVNGKGYDQVEPVDASALEEASAGSVSREPSPPRKGTVA
jgi:hypothetical protein